MIVVLAGRGDEAARSLVTRWAGEGVALLTPEDLSEPGWRYRPGAPDEGIAVVAGRPIETRQIGAVVTLLSAVGEDELVCILASERAYVAAEMTAFLVAWLSELPCAVVNRATPGCLMGPSWSPDRWRLGAVRAGCRVSDLAFCDERATTMTAIGDTWVGKGDPELGRAARRLAREARVDCLAVTFSGPEPDAGFVTAHLAPDVLDPAVSSALLEHVARQVVPA